MSQSAANSFAERVAPNPYQQQSQMPTIIVQSGGSSMSFKMGLAVVIGVAGMAGFYFISTWLKDGPLGQLFGYASKAGAGIVNTGGLGPLSGYYTLQNEQRGLDAADKKCGKANPLDMEVSKCRLGTATDNLLSW